MKFRTLGILVLITAVTTAAALAKPRVKGGYQSRKLESRVPSELVTFMAVAPRPRPYLTGGGVPLVDPQIKLPIYAYDPPARPYDVIGYVKMSNAPEGDQPRAKALQSVAECGQRHGGAALYLVEPRWGEYMIAAVLKWK